MSLYEDISSLIKVVLHPIRDETLGIVLPKSPYTNSLTYVPAWVQKALKRLRVTKNILWMLDTLRMGKEEFSESRLLSVRRPIQGPHVVKIFQGRYVPITRTACNKTSLNYLFFVQIYFTLIFHISHPYH